MNLDPKPMNTLGRYQIVREIARSNDVVYEAWDPVLNRRVALKELLIPPHLTGSARRERVERFYREARAAGRLDHPGIVTIYEVGQEGDRHFIAMEYLEGQSLRERLQVEGPLSIEETLHIAIQVLDALAYAHSQGVIHRDIKPDNIHLLPNGTVKLTDFGIARLMVEPSLTTDGQVFGTPSYMSPEQVAGKTVDERTDLFSLGVTMYEMLTGQKPFQGDSIVTITYKIMHHNPLPVAGLPEPLQAFFAKALAKDPSQRFQSALEMKSALLEMVTNGLTVSAPSPPNSLTSIATNNLVPEPTVSLGSKTFFPYSTLLRFFFGVFLGVLLSLLVIGLVVGVRYAYARYLNYVTEQAIADRFDRALRLYSQKRYREAGEEFADIARRAGNTQKGQIAKHNAVVAFISWGDSLENQNPQLALQAYLKAVAVDPQSSLAHLQLGNFYYHLGYRAKAEQEWQTAIRLEPASKEAQTARQNLAVYYLEEGDRFAERGDYERARQYWERAFEADPAGQAGLIAEERLHQFSSPHPVDVFPKW